MEPLKCNKCGRACKNAGGLASHMKRCGEAKNVDVKNIDDAKNADGAEGGKNEPVYKKESIPKPLRAAVWRNQFESMDGQCYCCYGKISFDTQWECGHIVSERDGGSTQADNLRPVCVNCNRSMGTTNMHEFMKKHNMPGLAKIPTPADDKLVRDFGNVYSKLCEVVKTSNINIVKRLINYLLNATPIDYKIKNDIFDIALMSSGDPKWMGILKNTIHGDDTMRGYTIKLTDYLNRVMSNEHIPWDLYKEEKEPVKTVNTSMRDTTTMARLAFAPPPQKYVSPTTLFNEMSFRYAQIMRFVCVIEKNETKMQFLNKGLEDAGGNIQFTLDMDERVIKRIEARSKESESVNVSYVGKFITYYDFLHKLCFGLI